MKKYVQVGCGHRGALSYSVPLVKDYSQDAELCGVYDTNVKRAKLVSELCGKEIDVYNSFTQMLDTVKPDTVIVTSIDQYHDEYIIKALNAGCDVISEKPLTTTFEKALAIKKAEQINNKKVTVTFNLRFHPFFVKLKEIVGTGVLGDILSVHFEWMLGITHGADYFRRWHAERVNSGSLLVHKSTHHFDIVNWLVEQDPVSVNAFGTRRVFGDVREQKADRCLNCKDRCEFYYDLLKDENCKKLYYDCEDADGYLRDACVFDKRIDIEDSISVNVLYNRETIMSYTLSANTPYEGMKIVLNGTKARIEATNIGNIIKIYKHTGEVEEIDLGVNKKDGHGGADEKIRDNLFKGIETEVPEQSADLRAGIMSIGIGMAANISMKENRRVNLSDYLGNEF